MRSGSIAAACAALTVVCLPVVASAAPAQADAPVAYAVTAAYDVPALEGTGNDTASIVFRSPGAPGTTGGTFDEQSLPVGPLSTGTSWFLDVNRKVGWFDDSVPPAGATAPTSYQSTATLSGSGSVDAHVRADYMLEAQGGAQHVWLYLDDATSIAQCPGLRGTGGSGLWVRQPDGALARVPLPLDEPYTVRDVPLRLPQVTVADQDLPQFADISVRTAGPGELVGADGTVAAGWRVDVDSYVVGANGREDRGHSVLVLGGAACTS
ncbi:hypothetical protein [Amycolatopsis sacchari]|uniref:Uncharacterized protein n=1 Tax=Amycolatopsis sacchari TaxID=115433 RepID=A0A1I3M3V1_9PSEU|nr:hypothetical protein [Amycolatopsis sacchari]SFI91694.1 hypothetical protein SAMN05421835_102169 [Amycolatopsis sacchari]